MNQPQIRVLKSVTIYHMFLLIMWACRSFDFLFDFTLLYLFYIYLPTFTRALLIKIPTQYLSNFRFSNKQKTEAAADIHVPLAKKLLY